MKKNIVVSLFISSIINFLCLLVNLIGALFFNVVPFSISLSGGEVVQYIGFGILLDKFYFFSVDGGISYNISFNLLSFVISFILIFIIVLLIKMIVNKFINK